MVFLTTAIALTDAVVNVPASYVEAAQSFRCSRLQLVRDVVLPATLPSIIVTLRLSAGIAILVVVGVEFVHGGDGMGYLIWQSWQLFAAPRMYVGIVTVAVLGVVFQSLVGYLGRRLAPWAGPQETSLR